MNELGSKEGFRGQGSNALAGNTLNFKAAPMQLCQPLGKKTSQR